MKCWPKGVNKGDHLTHVDDAISKVPLRLLASRLSHNMRRRDMQTFCPLLTLCEENPLMDSPPKGSVLKIICCCWTNSRQRDYKIPRNNCVILTFTMAPTNILMRVLCMCLVRSCGSQRKVLKGFSRYGATTEINTEITYEWAQKHLIRQVIHCVNSYAT